MFIAALFKESRCPSTNEQTIKVWYIHIIKYCLAINKNKIMKSTDK